MTMLPSSLAAASDPQSMGAIAQRPGRSLQMAGAGLARFHDQPAMSIVYGLLIFLISLGFVGGLIALGRDYILFPAFAGFMVVGPILGRRPL